MVYKYSPTIMLEIFRFQNNIGYHLKRQNSFKTSLRISINNGTGSISYLGPEVWELAPNNLKIINLLGSFKKNPKEMEARKIPIIIYLFKAYVQHVIGFIN